MLIESVFLSGSMVSDGPTMFTGLNRIESKWNFNQSTHTIKSLSLYTWAGVHCIKDIPISFTNNNNHNEPIILVMEWDAD